MSRITFWMSGVGGPWVRVGVLKSAPPPVRVRCPMPPGECVGVVAAPLVDPNRFESVEAAEPLADPNRLESVETALPTSPDRVGADALPIEPDRVGSAGTEAPPADASGVEVRPATNPCRVGADANGFDLTGVTVSRRVRVRGVRLISLCGVLVSGAGTDRPPDESLILMAPDLPRLGLNAACAGEWPGHQLGGDPLA